jgi:8-oxo-dGTP pyrophosphatase MutT (NUDIX family)
MRKAAARRVMEDWLSSEDRNLCRRSGAPRTMVATYSGVGTILPNAPRPTLYSNSEGEQIPYDGVSPITWRIASYVLATRDDGKVLAIEPPWLSRWEPPGGAVEIDESVVDAAIRECWEETGYRFVPANGNPICILEHNYLSPRDKSYQHSLMLAFQGTVEGGQDPAWQVDPTEVRTIRWIDPKTLTREKTHGLLWKALQVAGIMAAPAEG